MQAYHFDRESQRITDIINDKVVFFGMEDFKKKIVEGDDCFMCGTSRSQTEFSDEHVIPNWILKKFKVHNATIDLPNRTRFSYGRSTIPCCRSCNSLLGKEVERPISKLLALPHEEMSKLFADQENVQKLFVWMSLIFLKTHLKVMDLSNHRDKRKGEEKIGELHDWGVLHHVHCVARVPVWRCWQSLLPASCQEGVES